MTMMQEESQPNLHEMTELLNETALANHMSEEQQMIVNAKFQQLFSRKLETEVKQDIE